MNNFEVGDSVRIVEDEYPQLVGLTGIIQKFGNDETTAWVTTGKHRGLWCSLSNLEKAERNLFEQYEVVTSDYGDLVFRHKGGYVILGPTQRVSLDTLIRLVQKDEIIAE